MNFFRRVTSTIGYEQKKTWKLALFVAALVIGVSSLLYTNNLVKKLSIEEQKRIHLWADAYIQLLNASSDNENLNFESEVIKNNVTIPVILADENDHIISVRNVDSTKLKDTTYLQGLLQEMKAEQTPIVIHYGNNPEAKQYIYYKNSYLVTQLKYYPYVQLCIISLFITVSYLAFSASRKYEQNRVWVGMSKETAHQLGTPLSSLLAWIEYLKENPQKLDKSMVLEMEKDLDRLQVVTERFSKIGSVPVLKEQSVNEVIEGLVEYFHKRTSRKVNVNIEPESDKDQMAMLSPPLFEWVIENLTKNAIDALNGEGKISYLIKGTEKQVVIDVTDTGKGIPKSQFKTVFNPGYTTRKRGWGLGLSLAKRIIENYHGGSIYVKESEIGKGTRFRIRLNKKA